MTIDLVDEETVEFHIDCDDEITNEEIRIMRRHINNGVKKITLMEDRENMAISYPINQLEKLYKLEVLHIQDFRYTIVKLPPKLKEFSTGRAFNQDIGRGAGKLYLPGSLEKIIFGFCFNKPIAKYPKNLKYLKFGRNFDQPVNNLPAGLESLSFCGDFDQPIDNLPGSLKTLSFFSIYDSFFNQKIDNLPGELEQLFLGDWFNKPIDFLPSKIRTLYLGKNFNQKIDNLPGQLNKLVIIYDSNFNESIDNLPDSIEHLQLPLSYTVKIKKLPSNLKKLIIYESYPYIKELRKDFKDLFVEHKVQISKKLQSD